MRRQLFGDSWNHSSNSALARAVGTAKLAAHRHVAGNAGHHDNAAMLGAVGYHLLGCQLGGEIGAHDVGRQQILVFFVSEFQERNVTVDTGTRDADVESIVEILAELGKAFAERLLRADVDSRHSNWMQ